MIYIAERGISMGVENIYKVCDCAMNPIIKQENNKNK
jgi:hypothetical protein